MVAILKFLPPILHGLLGLSIWRYSSHVLKWPSRKSLFFALLATLSFVALRISWDLLRNEIALIFLFLFLTMLGNDRRSIFFRALVMTLIVFTHQLVAVLMLGIIAGTAIQKLLKHDYSSSKRLLLSAIPSILLFVLVIYAKFVSSPGFSLVGVSLGAEAEGWVLAPLGFTSYSEMVVNLGGFFLYCFSP